MIDNTCWFAKRHEHILCLVVHLFALAYVVKSVNALTSLRSTTRRSATPAARQLQRCEHLGTSPGHWYDGYWQTFDATCQSQQWSDLIEGRSMHIVLFGDSIERLTAQDLAEADKRICCNVRGETSVECNGQCRSNSSIFIETLHNNGVWPNGPFFMDESLPLSAANAWEQVR